MTTLAVSARLAALSTHMSRWCRFNSSTASLSRPNRRKYPRLYATTIVNPDGSSYTVRYHEPRQVITLPIDYDQLSEEQQLQVLSMRKPKKKAKGIQDALDGDSFSADSYLKNFKAN